MRTSHRGLLAIEAREGVRLKAYRDSKNLPTIGVGHLIVPGDGFSMSSRITQEQCDELFAKDVRKYEDAVNSLNVSLSQNQFDSLVSFSLNIGIGGLKGSTVAKRLKAGDYPGAATAMMKWVKPKEITGRRKSEQKQFLTPYPKSLAAAPTTTSHTDLPTGQTAEPTNDATESTQEKPPSIDNPEIEQKADTIVNTGSLLGKADAVGTKFQEFNGVLAKFGFQVEDATTSLGTKLLTGGKFILGVLMMLAGVAWNHWEYFVMAGLLIALAVLLWDRSKARVAKAQEGMPVEVVKQIVAATAQTQ